MGAVIWAVANSPLSTGSSLGDITSYGLLTVIAAASWRLFRWWRADQTATYGTHSAEVARYQRNQLALLAYVTILSVEVARLGGEVPPAPNLE